MTGDGMQASSCKNTLRPFPSTKLNKEMNALIQVYLEKAEPLPPLLIPIHRLPTRDNSCTHPTMVTLNMTRLSFNILSLKSWFIGPCVLTFLVRHNFLHSESFFWNFITSEWECEGSDFNEKDMTINKDLFCFRYTSHKSPGILLARHALLSNLLLQISDILYFNENCVLAYFLFYLPKPYVCHRNRQVCQWRMAIRYWYVGLMSVFSMAGIHRGIIWSHSDNRYGFVSFLYSSASQPQFSSILI